MVKPLSELLSGKSRLVRVVLQAGSSTWTVPDNIQGNVIWLTAAAGGGGGGRDVGAGDAGGGGGGGACCVKYPVWLGSTPPASVAYNVGAGGAAGTAGVQGGDTDFGPVVGRWIDLMGGKGGASTGAGGAGGAVRKTGSGITTPVASGNNTMYGVQMTSTGVLADGYGPGASADSDSARLGNPGTRGCFYPGGGGGAGPQASSVEYAGGSGYAPGGGEAGSDKPGGGGSLGQGGSDKTPDIPPNMGGGGIGGDSGGVGQAGADGVMIIEYWSD